MTSAALPLQDALKVAIDAALEAAGYTCRCETIARKYPAVVIGDGTEAGLQDTKARSVTTCTHTVRVFARKQVEALELAAVVITAMSGTISPAGFSVLDQVIELNLPLQDRDESGAIYGRAIRARYECQSN